MKKEQFQSLIVTLSDGSKGVFTGKVLTTSISDKRTIVDIKFTEPKPMPKGVQFVHFKSD